MVSVFLDNFTTWSTKGMPNRLLKGKLYNPGVPVMVTNDTSLPDKSWNISLAGETATVPLSDKVQNMMILTNSTFGVRFLNVDFQLIPVHVISFPILVSSVIPCAISPYCVTTNAAAFVVVGTVDFN